MFMAHKAHTEENGMSSQKILRELKKTVQRMSAASEDNRFVLWFLAAYTGEDPETESLVKAVTGGSGDGGIDGVYVNERARRVVLVQGKYGRSFASKYLNDFTVVADNLWELVERNGSTTEDDHQEAEKWWSKLNGSVQKALLGALKCLEKEYELRLIYVTIANVPRRVQAKWKKQAHHTEEVFEIFDQRDVLGLFKDYCHHRAYVDETQLLSANGYLRTETSGVESFLLPVRVRDLAELYKREGDKLFALQVRGFLGDNLVNRAIQHTLRYSPEEFWFYNNGVTIVCDEAVPSQRGGKWRLNLKNPQIINGQQTVRKSAETDARNTERYIRKVCK